VVSSKDKQSVNQSIFVYYGMTKLLLCLITPQWQQRHTHPFNGPLSGTTRVTWYQKGKPIWILLKQETVSGSGISWAICKSTPRSRQTTMPAPHHSRFFKGRMPFLPPNQQRQSNEGNNQSISQSIFVYYGMTKCRPTVQRFQLP